MTRDAIENNARYFSDIFNSRFSGHEYEIGGLSQ